MLRLHLRVPEERRTGGGYGGGPPASWRLALDKPGGDGKAGVVFEGGGGGLRGGDGGLGLLSFTRCSELPTANVESGPGEVAPL